MPVPKPRKGENQDSFVSRCASQLADEDPNVPNKQRVAMCFQAWRDRGKEMVQSNNKDWRTLEFAVPIKNSVSESEGQFKIRGIAINETTTRNGITYVAEELQASAQSLRNKPILKDHVNSVDNIVGRTTENVNFNDAKKAIEFEARIVDKAIQEKIKAGLISSVSIGATVQDIEESVSEETGEVTQRIARGIDFVELSLVAVPADKNAGIAMAMAESFNLRKKQDKKVQAEKTQKEELLMAEEISKLEQLRQEQAQLEEEIMQMKIEKLKAEKEALAKVEEKVEEAVEEKTEQVVEDKTEGVVVEEQETSELDSKYVVEKSAEFGGYALSVRR